ncbi:MAG: hypothetical protein RL596_2074, partial [Bacteroidota bacterium]
MLLKNIGTLIISFSFFFATAQIQPAPEKKEGDGPYTQLILRGG